MPCPLPPPLHGITEVFTIIVAVNVWLRAATATIQAALPFHKQFWKSKTA